MISLLLALTLAAPNELSTQIKARLGDAPVLQGTFESAKQVRGFKRPLKSSGTYVVTRGQGVTWSTLLPFASELTVTASDITSKQSGVEVFHLDAKTEPSVRAITGLLLALLSGDLEALSAQFDAQGEVGARDWRLELTPRSPALLKVFSRVSLRGDGFVRSVHLTEASGDATLITLTPKG